MDKIKIFKEKALAIEVDIMQDYYPGNPIYIGRESDEKAAEYLKRHAAENNIELPAIDGIVFHYYPVYTPESQMVSYYNDALFSAPDMSLDYLRAELKELEAYSYKELFGALDVLSSRFANEEIMCSGARHDVKRFKNIFYTHFKQRLPISGRITQYFVGGMRKEIRLREKYLEMLTNKVKDVIDIKLENVEKVTQLTSLANRDSKILNDKFEDKKQEVSDSVTNSNNTKMTPQTKTLFNFIDFLHSNIENINQNMGVLLEWKKARWQERQFGQHYSEKLIMREVQKVIRAKWDEISEHLIEPIKEKAIEINVCVLDNPKSIYTNFSHHVVMLQENFHEEDVDEIMKVKKQYIEIRNDINPHIILLLKDFFKYFDELMKHLVAFFYEDGDRTIPRIVDIYLDDYFSTPESFELPLSDSQVKDFYDSLLIEHQEVICEDTDFDYFSYAISGKEIPLKKTPYKPVVLAGTIDSMYYELFNLMKNCGEIPEKRKTIPQKYVMLAEKLFLNKNENPLKLRTPK